MKQETTSRPTTHSPTVYFWFAIWSGLCVACIYFCQPLLHLFALEFGVTDQKVSLVATATQIGYGLGIFLLLPLGDFFPKKRLILFKLCLLAAAVFACAIAPTLFTLVIASFAVGLFATTAQDVVPVAADLAPDNRRAQFVGFVMTGLMLGILLSRTVSGIIAAQWGWRTVFYSGTGMIAICILTCLRFFPKLEQPTKSSLFSIYASMAALFRKHSKLRLAVVRQGFLALAFSGFWTCLSFYLSNPPFSWDSSRIGLMGLAGGIGAVSTSFIGKFSDRHGPHYMIRLGGALALLSFAGMGFFPQSVPVLILGVIIFDLGIQCSLISQQSIIYGLDPTARGRINGIFVSSLFVFFALGSAISGWVWSHYGWPGLMISCALCSTGTLALSHK